MIDAEQLPGDRRNVGDGGLAAAADVEGFAVILLLQVEGGVHEGLDHVVDIDEVAGDVGMDEGGVAALPRRGG